MLLRVKCWAVRKSYTQSFSVQGCWAELACVEEQDVGLDSARVEDPGGQAQQGVDVVLFQQSSADFSPAPPSKSTLSGRTTAARPSISSSRGDVLDEVELLVGGGDPEVGRS